MAETTISDRLARQISPLHDVEALLLAIDAACADGQPPEKLAVNSLARMAAEIVAEVRDEIDAASLAAARGAARA